MSKALALLELSSSKPIEVLLVKLLTNLTTLEEGAREVLSTEKQKSGSWCAFPDDQFTDMRPYACLIHNTRQRTYLGFAKSYSLVSFEHRSAVLIHLQDNLAMAPVSQAHLSTVLKISDVFF